MTLALDRALRALRRRERLATTLGVLSLHLALALCVGGVLALLLRMGWGLRPSVAAWALAPAALAPLSAWLVARRRFLCPESLASWLDLRAGAGGLLLTEHELDDELWRAQSDSQLERVQPLPALRLRASAWRCLASLGFAALVLWVDVSAPRAPFVPPAVYQSALQELREQLAALEEVPGLEEERARELEQRMQALEQEAEDSSRPEATFEAIDQLGGELAQEGAEARERALQAFEALEGAAEGSEAQPEAALEALELASRELGAVALPSELAQKLGAGSLPETLALPEGLSLDPAALRELSQALQQLLQEQLNGLAQAGLFEPVELRELALAEAGGEAGDLAQFGELPGEGEGAGMGVGEVGLGPGLGLGAEGGGPIPGFGGVSRGRADAAMRWGDESPGRSEEFAPERLSPSQFEDLEHSQVLGLGSAAPSVQTQAESAGLAAIRASSGRAAWKRRLSPRHRRAVGTFFAPVPATTPAKDDR